MRVAIFGAGGVGGYFGGRLAQAGEDVTFIARGAHLEAIRRNGLTVESIAGDFRVLPAAATDDTASVDPVDVVLVCVKAWQIEGALPAMRPLVGFETAVIPLENGVEAPDQLAHELGKDRVLGGLCKILATISSPGTVRHAGVDPTIAFGEMDGTGSERVERLRAVFRRAKGMTVESPDDIRVALWQKFIFISAMSGVGAVTRAPAGMIRALPETRRMLERAMREAQAVGRRRGIAIPEETAAKTLAFFDTLPDDSIASMHRDIVEGRPSELDYQTGAVVRLGKEAGVPTPVSELIYAALLPQEIEARRAEKGGGSRF